MWMYITILHSYEMQVSRNDYGVAVVSRLLQIIGLFCKRALQKRPIFSKETYDFREPTNRGHPP